MKNKTDTERWFHHSSFDESWKERSGALLRLFAERILDVDASYEFAEYGCGAYSPFTQVASKYTNISTIEYDLRAWNDGVRVIDLNDRAAVIEAADVCVLSGVCEYFDFLDVTPPIDWVARG